MTKRYVLPASLLLLPLLLGLPLVGGCLSPAADPRVEIVGEGGPIIALTLTGDGAALTDASRASIELYGHDPGTADGRDLLLRLMPLVSALPFSRDVELPAAPHTLIVGDPSPLEARYNFIVTIDVDDDGWVCEGDYRRDYDALPASSWTIAEADAMSVPMIVIEDEGGLCVPL